jgi:hypothetical protein
MLGQYTEIGHDYIVLHFSNSLFFIVSGAQNDMNLNEYVYDFDKNGRSWDADRIYNNEKSFLWSQNAPSHARITQQGSRGWIDGAGTDPTARCPIRAARRDTMTNEEQNAAVVLKAVPDLWSISLSLLCGASFGTGIV